MRAPRRLVLAQSLPAAMLALPALALALVAALAYEAWSAERSRQAAEAAALRDHAAFAAAQVARGVRNAVINVAEPALAPVAWTLRDAAARELPPLSALAEPEMKPACPHCLSPDTATRFFRAELGGGGGRLETSGPVGAAERAWILRTVGAALPRPDEASYAARTLFGRTGGRAWGLGYAVRRDARGRPSHAYGFLAPPAAFVPALREMEGRYPFLPGGRERDSLVSYTVRDGEGNVVFASAARYGSRVSARDTVGSLHGRLGVEVTLHPDAARVLLPGGVSGSRLPYILGLLVLAGALLGVALLQFRRHHQLARMRTDFIANVSHELRTPVAQIRVFTDTLLLGWARTEEDRRRCLEIIGRESVRLSQLIDNVIQFTRVGRSDAPLEIRPTRLDAQVREAVEAFAPLSRAHGAEVALRLEPVTAPADRSALRQVVLNLLNNAVKYGPEGQRLEVALARRGDRARLSVEDQGPGVPAAERERIWEAFERQDREVERTTGGSGIGLAVVRALVEQHEGKTWVEEGSSGGARFVVELPGAGPGEAEEEACEQGPPGVSRR